MCLFIKFKSFWQTSKTVFILQNAVEVQNEPDRLFNRKPVLRSRLRQRQSRRLLQKGPIPAAEHFFCQRWPVEPGEGLLQVTQRQAADGAKQRDAPGAAATDSRRGAAGVSGHGRVIDGRLQPQRHRSRVPARRAVPPAQRNGQRSVLSSILNKFH